MLYFIVNQTARTGKSSKVWEKVQTLLADVDIPYKFYMTEYENHATELAKMISQKDDMDICIIVVGGDGTMNEVINGIVDFERVRFGIIPAGSGNDFGRGLGIGKDVEENVKRIIRAYQSGRECYQSMDLGKVSWDSGTKSRFFGISSGVGMDAIVCKKALHSGMKTFLNKLHLGKMTYILLTIQTLFSMDTATVEVVYDKESRHFERLIFMAAMNLRAEGGGVPMAPKATPFDGRLSLSNASGIPKWRTFFCLPVLVAAKHERIKGFHVTDSTLAKVTISKPFVLHADGEYCGDVTEATFTCETNKLHMLL
ncbi:MAG: YegS/Rv2252/BmrU family lipid kinase [Agathobacter sp.]|nr:YegS/Rv2252/BmrU family lipid kinase [Agathobacter sp.]